MRVSVFSCFMCVHVASQKETDTLAFSREKNRQTHLDSRNYPPKFWVATEMNVRTVHSKKKQTNIFHICLKDRFTFFMSVKLTLFVH